MYQINGATIEVRKVLESGLLESVYHKFIKKELAIRGIQYQSELNVPVICKREEILTELRCDLFIENTLCVELKAINKMTQRNLRWKMYLQMCIECCVTS